MKAIRNPEVVDAYQFVSTNDDIGVETFPAWLVTVLGQHVWINPADDEGTPWRVTTADGRKKAAIGDWIVRDNNGGLSVFEEQEFKTSFFVSLYD